MPRYKRECRTGLCRWIPRSFAAPRCPPRRGFCGINFFPIKTECAVAGGVRGSGFAVFGVDMFKNFEYSGQKGNSAVN